MEKRLPLPAGTVLQGRYRIVRQLGHGGFGAVYEAIDDEIGKSFALKETFYATDEDLRQAFKREARLLASLEHDAFPDVSHYFTENDGCFLVMELVRGDDLDKLLAARSTPFEQEQVLAWADQILDALEDLHAKGIIHRDIKPSNLRLTPKGKLKLLDFGIAKGTLEGETTLLTTVGSMAAATMQYAPLEQVLKASPQHQMMLSVVSSDKVEEVMRCSTDATSDLFALAATLYHLLTKTLPADAPTRALAIWSGSHDRLIPVRNVNPQVSKSVSDVLNQAMSLDQHERLSSAREMREMLKAATKPVVAIKPVLSVTPPPNITPTIEQPIIQPTQRPFKSEPFNPVQTEEVGQLANVRKQSDKGKNNLVWLAAMLFVSAILAVIVGGITYLALFPNNGQANKTNSVDANTSSNTNSVSSNANRNTNSNTPMAVNDKFILGDTLAPQAGLMYSVAFSPDGKTIASGSGDKMIRLWDAASGTLKQILSGHGLIVNSVVFSPDGKTIVSGGDDNTVKIWDAASGTLKQTLSGHSGLIWAVAFSPDGKTIASVSRDKTIKLWDALNYTLKQTLSGHNDEVMSIAFSPDGKTIASGSGDKTIKLWDAASGTLKQTLTGHSNSVRSVVFSPDSKTIVSGSWDKTIKWWDAATGNLKQTLTGHDAFILTIAFSPDGKMIASGSSDKTIKIWDTISGTLKQTLTGHDNAVYSVVFSPDSKTIASGSGDNTIKIWRVE